MLRNKKRRISTQQEEYLQAKTSCDELGENIKSSQQTKSLFVHSLPKSATSKSLTALFSQAHPLKHANVVSDPVTKSCKGYGFVTFADYQDAQSALHSFDGASLDGCKIKVEAAEPRRRDPSQGKKIHEKHGSPRSVAGGSDQSKIPDRPKHSQSPKLIVRNLPWSFKEADQLVDLFTCYGNVKFATLPKKRPGISPGFGFVVMQAKKSAENAMHSLNGKSVEGRKLAVDWAVEKNIWETLQENEKVAKFDLRSPAENVTSKLEPSILFGDGNDSFEPQQDLVASAPRSTSYKSISVIDKNLEHDTGVINDSTLFVRNIPFDVIDDVLHDRFETFGPIRYARVVIDPLTARSKGVGFVCFYRREDADTCLQNAPKVFSENSQQKTLTRGVTPSGKHSILEDYNTDISGNYTLQRRVLNVCRAVDKIAAERLTSVGKSIRTSRDNDKRRLYLLSEGTISADSPLYEHLSEKETNMRENSYKQRQTLVKRNPLLHLSLTRLSIRNLPRNITSKDLKALARKAVVEFAKDVKAGTRKPLSKEELSRGGDEQKKAERARKIKRKGIVKQAKVVFEIREGKKVAEDSGAGRSSGYGFIEYSSHRWALMGLRWLNGYSTRGLQALCSKEITDKQSLLIVEFAIENTQVVGKRFERENKARERSKAIIQKNEAGKQLISRTNNIKTS